MTLNERIDSLANDMNTGKLDLMCLLNGVVDGLKDHGVTLEMIEKMDEEMRIDLVMSYVDFYLKREQQFITKLRADSRFESFFALYVYNSVKRN